MKAIEVDCDCGALAGVMCAGGKPHPHRVKRARSRTRADRSVQLANDKKSKAAIDALRSPSAPVVRACRNEDVGIQAMSAAAVKNRSKL